MPQIWCAWPAALRGLLHLDARETAVVIRRAYALNRVQIAVIGDWYEVQQMLRMTSNPHDPVGGYSALWGMVETGALADSYAADVPDDGA